MFDQRDIEVLNKDVEYRKNQCKMPHRFTFVLSKDTFCIFLLIIIIIFC